MTITLEESLRWRPQCAGLPPDGYVLKVLRERLGGGKRGVCGAVRAPGRGVSVDRPPADGLASSLFAHEAQQDPVRLRLLCPPCRMRSGVSKPWSLPR
jgi:hypothetical protein